MSLEKGRTKCKIMVKYHIPPIDLEKEENWINRLHTAGMETETRSDFLRYEFTPKKTDLPH